MDFMIFLTQLLTTHIDAKELLIISTKLPV